MIVVARFDVAVANDDQQCDARCGTNEVAEEEDRRLVRPVQVIDDENRRPSCGDTGEQRRDRLEEPITLGFGVAGDGARRRTKSSRELGEDARQIVFQTVQALVQRRCRVHRDAGAQRLDERLVRDDRLFVAAPIEDDATLVVHLVGQRAREAGFADARLAAHEHELQVTIACALPRAFEPAKLVVSVRKSFVARRERRCGQSQGTRKRAE